MLFGKKRETQILEISKGFKSKIRLLIQLFLVVSWMNNLALTDAYVSVYALCTAIAVIAISYNFQHQTFVTGKRELPIFVLSALFSLSVVLANYPLFQMVRPSESVSASTNAFFNIYNGISTFLGGLVVGYHTQVLILNRFSKYQPMPDNNTKPKMVFFGLFCLFLAQYLVYLFFVVYPGSVTSDSIGQIIQIYKGRYINNHPYWHTQLIRLCMTVGYRLFGTANAAAATYSFVQSAFMAGCFAYVGVTLYQKGITGMWLAVSMGMYFFLPNHFTYSCTMWKDVPFSLFILLMITAMIRIFCDVGRSRFLNYGLFCVGLLCACLMRTNGWYAMLMTLLISLPFLWKQHKKMMISGFSCIVLAWLLLNPVLSLLQVAETNMLEALSVPIQQVARVISEGGKLTDEENALLDAIVDRSVIPENYDPNCSDEMKDAILRKSYGGIHVIQANWSEYLKLWIGLGVRYPRQYLEAWIELTKGYWNAGYDYYIYAEYVSDNDLGIYMVPQKNLIHNLVKAYCMFTRESHFFEPLQSIGLHVWLTVFCFYRNVRDRRKSALVYIPLLVILAGLWLGTPVFAEFRYAYPMFAAFPLLLPLALHSEETAQ